MKVHTFADGKKPVMVLIHGVLTPWQIWLPQINAFKDRYDIYAIALNAHTAEQASEYISVSSECDEIISYFDQRGIDEIDVMCGISLGGKIAYNIFKSERLKIRSLVLDGAPLIKCPSIAVGIMTKNYTSIIHSSKKRDARVIENFKKYFLPEKYLEEYLKIADLMTDSSIKNIVHSSFTEDKFDISIENTRILFIHGTKGNEILSKQSARLLKKHCKNTDVVCFKNDPHCYKAIYRPEEWIRTVENFLNEQ